MTIDAYLLALAGVAGNPSPTIKMIIIVKKDLPGRKPPSCDKAKRPDFIENRHFSPRRLSDRKGACCLFSSVLATFDRAIKACPIPKL